MKKIMILGASILQLPAILKAKDMGFQVVAVDMDKNAVGFKHADISLEISTIDTPKIIEMAKKYRIDGIMTLASDMPMRSVAKVAEKLNLVGINEDIAFKATNKVAMRECLNKNNVPIPKFFKVRDYMEYMKVLNEFKREIIVKPSDNSGSRGVVLLKDLNNKEEIRSAFEYSMENSRSGEVVVEDYMKGFEVSVESVSINGEIHVISITDKLTTGGPNFVEMGHSQPSQLPNDIKDNIKNLAIDAIRAIGIDNGPSHTEIIITEEGPKIVEIGARLGGDNITSHLVPLSTGIDLVQVCIQIAMGIEPNLKHKFLKGSAIRYFDYSVEGRIKSINGLEEVKSIKGVKQVEFTKKIGDRVNKVMNSADRVGFIISQSNNVKDAVEICNKGKELIKIGMEK